MKFLKSIIVAGLIGLPVLANAESKTHFSLNNQLFSETKDTTKMSGARYDLPYVYATTNLIYSAGTYTTLNDHGFFNAELKDPAQNWSVSIDAFFGLDNYQYKSRSIKLTAENGETIIISIKRGNVTFNGEDVYDAPVGARLTFGVKNTASNVELTINGSKVGTAEYSDFNKLKFVEAQLVSEYIRQESGWSYAYHPDVLHNMVIGER